MGQLRNKIIIVSKVLVASALIWWLANTGKLDLQGVAIYWHSSSLAAMTLSVWILGSVLTCTLRWRTLVQALGISLPLWQALRLNLIGLFFNTFMPGAVGGDLIKALYLCRQEHKQARTRIFLTAFLDRIMGLMALFLISLAGLAWNWQLLMAHPLMRPLVVFLLALGVVATAAIGALILLKRQRQALWYKALRSKLRRLPGVVQLWQTAAIYQNQKRALGLALGFALLHQGLFVVLFLAVTATLTSGPLPVGLLLAILPLGIVTTALPLAPGGLGVGHMAFEKLFQLIDLTGGANVFNIITLGQLALNLLGSIAYIFYKSEVTALLLTKESSS